MATRTKLSAYLLDVLEKQGVIADQDDPDPLWRQVVGFIAERHSRGTSTRDSLLHNLAYLLRGVSAMTDQVADLNADRNHLEMMEDA